MKLIIYIFPIFLFLFEIVNAKSIKSENYLVNLKKNGVLTTSKKGKVVSIFDLKFISKTARVEKFEKVKKNNSLFVADIFQGHEGVNLTKACFRANLIKVTKDGKIVLVDKLIYRCDIASTKLNEEGEESFYRPYEVVKSKLVFKKY